MGQPSTRRRGSVRPTAARQAGRRSCLRARAVALLAGRPAPLHALGVSPSALSQGRRAAPAAAQRPLAQGPKPAASGPAAGLQHVR